MLLAGLIIGFSFSQQLRNNNCTFQLSLPSGVFSAREDEYEGHTIALLPAGADDLLTRSVTATTDNNTLAAQLYNETRVLCWVLTSPANHAKKAIHVKNTWGARCNRILFMSSESDKELGSVKLPVKEGRGNLWHKTREALKYIYDHHFDEADWFLKADDDTYDFPSILDSNCIIIWFFWIFNLIFFSYVIVENLRAFLYSFDSKAPIYFGCKFKKYVRQVSALKTNLFVLY